jgi:hypothetical protein
MRRMGSVPEPRSISQEESSATNFTPSKVFTSASGERSSFAGGFFSKFHQCRALLQREMRVNPVIMVRAELLFQIRQQFC